MAMTFCYTALATEGVKNCEDPIVGGIERTGYLLNRADVDLVETLSAASPNTITEFVVKTGKRGYKLDNLLNLVTTKVDGTSANRFQKVLTATVLNDGTNNTLFIEQVADRDFEGVAVIRHKFKDANGGDNASIEVIGLFVGLSSNGQAIANDKNSADTLGGWSVTLATTEPKARVYWLDAEGAAATDALFDALETPAT